ncbi:MmcQ/YjbR family DNA-binding protein [bacterium]|nr:MmcQ/YjbR family DNA-binding protein [bacterium]
MIIENKIFERHTINKDKLISYGFEKVGNKLVYKTEILNGDFSVVIEYDGKIIGKIFDLATEEEYTNFRIENSNGFSSEIREIFIDILTDIRDKCCKNQLFITKQAQNINDYINEKYQDMPEFLWKNFPTYAIYRNKKNKKWYALIGTVFMDKVDKNSKSKEIVEIINLKIDKDKKEEILSKNGVYEAYHMNKKSWITIVFDGTLKDSEIINYLDESYKNIQ